MHCTNVKTNLISRCFKYILNSWKSNFYSSKKLDCVENVNENYDLSLNNLIAQISNKNISSKLKKSGNIYFIDKNAAETVALHISENWHENGYIFEANPGPGILSKAILETGVNHLRVFEKNAEFHPNLKILSSLYTGIEIIKEDILYLPIIEIKSFDKDNFQIENIFDGIHQCSWKSEDIPFRIVSIISSKRSIKFLRYLLAAVTSPCSLFSYGRCEFFFLLPKLEYEYMIAEPKENFTKYRWTTVLYNLFFEIKYLEKFSHECFMPSPYIKKKFKNGELQFYLVKLTPKPHLYDSVLPQHKLGEFYYFVRHHLIKRTALVIPTLENWIPFCGPRLIKEGMMVFTKFGDLSPNQILQLFEQFSSWPEYKHCTFQAALQRYYKKDLFSLEDESFTSED